MDVFPGSNDHPRSEHLHWLHRVQCSVSYIEIHFIISDQFLSRTNESSGYRRVGRRLPGREDMTVGTLTWKRKVQDDFSEDSGLM